MLWANPLAQTEQRLFTYLYPALAPLEGWKSSAVVVNIDQTATDVRLFAYDAGGTLIQEASGGLPLDSGERRVYSKEAGDWPKGTSSFKIESDGSLLNFLLWESSEGNGLETVQPVTAPNPVLTFPLIRNPPE